MVHRFFQEAPHYILVLHSPNRRWGLMRKNSQYDVLDFPAILLCIDGLSRWLRLCKGLDVHRLL